MNRRRKRLGKKLKEEIYRRLNWRLRCILSCGLAAAPEKKLGFWIPNMDMTGEILSRLPVKSIVRFMLVCKNWRDIITSPGFSSMHANNNPLYTFVAADHVNLLTPANASIRINNSCSNNDGRHYYRFGYSPSTKEYKVLRCAVSSSNNDHEYHILTVGVDQGWRKLSSHLFPIYMEHGNSPCMLPSFNGKFHWLAGHNSNSNFILAFDIAKESTRRIPFSQAVLSYHRLLRLRYRINELNITRRAYEKVPNRAFVLHRVGDINNYDVDFITSLDDNKVWRLSSLGPSRM